MSFLHGAILFGLFAMAIPPVVHLLNRRRFEVVDWAAMRFLQISQKTRQKVMFQQLALMLLRIFLIVSLVLAVAAPVLKLSCVSRLPGGGRLARLAGQSGRDIVLIVDGSYSMDCRWQNSTAHDAAKAWASDFLNDLGPNDRVAIIQAKQRPIPVLGLLTADQQDIRARLEHMPRPRGGVNWLKAMQEADRILGDGQSSQKEIVILTDGQRQGWADPRSLQDWQLLALNYAERQAAPHIWVVNVVPDRPDDMPNWSISPIRANRSLSTVGREVIFKFDLQMGMPASKGGANKTASTAPPSKITFMVDDEPAGERTVAVTGEPSVGMEFRKSFASTGSHLVSAIIGDDALPGDNRRDYAIDVLPAIPVLLVDGGESSLASARGSDFLRFAIAPANHPQPSFLLRTISVGEFASQSLTSPVTRDSWTLPRVLVLQNVARLSDTHHKSIEEFLKQGGGVFVLLGPRSEPESFNLLGFRGGAGWLPARLTAPAGVEKGKGTFPESVGLDRTFLDLFKQPGPESFLKSSFSRWWKLDTTAAGAGHVVAKLSTGDPLFVEKAVDNGAGRVLLAAVPFDDTWPTTLVQSHDFVRLCHECLFHLAGARSADVNLQAGQEINFRPLDGDPPAGVTLKMPDGIVKRLDVASWPLTFDETRETGVYKLTTDSGRAQYYVVQPDGAESNLTACKDQDRRAIASLFPEARFFYVGDRSQILQAFRQNQSDPELGWLLMLVLLALLTCELVVTRSMVKRNPPAGND